MKKSKKKTIAFLIMLFIIPCLIVIAKHRHFKAEENRMKEEINLIMEEGKNIPKAIENDKYKEEVKENEFIRYDYYSKY